MARKGQKQSPGRKTKIPRGPGGSNGGRCRQPSDEDLVSALNHRTRRIVLRSLHRADEPLSPASLSRALGFGVPSLSYHFKVLQRQCIVKLVGERPVRGAVEHFFESKVTDNAVALEILRNTSAGDEDEA